MKVLGKTVTLASDSHVPEADLVAAFKKLTSGIGGTFGLFREAILNAQDARAGRIWITVAGRGETYTVTILDDGIGMNDGRRRRFLDAAKEDLRSTGRGYQGLGVKRMAADFAHCRVDTICPDDGDKLMRSFEFDFEDLFLAYAKKNETPIRFQTRPADPASIGLPTGSTGSRILLTVPHKLDKKEQLSAETLIGRLSAELRPALADKVLVNKEPLLRRSLHAEPLRFVDIPKDLGRIEIELYVPKHRSRHDELRVWASEDPGPHLEDFLKRIPEEILAAYKDRLEILSEANGVFGTIIVEGFNRLMTSDRRDFEEKLYRGPLAEQFVKYLAGHVCEELAAHMQLLVKTETTKREQRMLERIREALSRLGKDIVSPPPKPPRRVLELDVSALEDLLPGSTATIRVTKHDPGLTIAWDTAQCGGTAQVRQAGRELSYRAGPTEGSYILSCFYEENQERRERVRITITPKRMLRIEPRTFTIRPGREYVLSAVHYEEDSSGAENLVWRIDQNDLEGRFVTEVHGQRKYVPVCYGSEVRYLAGSLLGEYSVTLNDLKRRKRTPVTCSIIVNNPPSPPARPKGSDAGHEQWIVTYTSHPQLWLSQLDVKGNRFELRINRSSPAYQYVMETKGESGVEALCVHAAVVEYVEATNAGGELTPPLRQALVGEEYARLLSLKE